MSDSVSTPQNAVGSFVRPSPLVRQEGVTSGLGTNPDDTSLDGGRKSRRRRKSAKRRKSKGGSRRGKSRKQKR